MSPACGACGGALRSWRRSVPDPETGARFAIDACADCGLGWTQPRPADTHAAYPDDYYGGRHGFTTRFRAERRLRRVAAVAGPGRSRSLLDVGCGDGAFLAAVQSAGWRPAGTELRPEAAAADAFDVRPSIAAFAGGTPFACVTAWHSLEHLRDPRGALEDVRSVLEPGGWLVVAVPNARGLQASCFGADWVHLDVPRHLVHFDPLSLARLLRRTGFDVVRRWDEELEYDVLGWSQSLLNAWMPTRNAWLRRLQGRPSRSGPVESAATWVVGVAASAAGAPLTVAGAILRCGGTVVVAARRRP